jgi:Domain of unknown function (DUF3291)
MQLAQVNIGRVKGPPDSPVMAGFMARLDEINALAERSPGFVWRLQTPAGNATDLRPYDDQTILINMSVWEGLDELRAYVFESSHRELLRQRREWFEKFEGVYAALWWVPDGHRPSLEEAKQRLAHLAANGPTPYAFTFKDCFPASVAQAADNADSEPTIRASSRPDSPVI